MGTVSVDCTAIKPIAIRTSHAVDSLCAISEGREFLHFISACQNVSR